MSEQNKTPDGCDRCPNNQNNKPTHKAWTARYIACLVIGFVMVGQCYDFSYGKPDPEPGTVDVGVGGGLYIKTKEPPYLLFGAGMLAVGALLEVPMGAIARIMSSGGNGRND